MLSKRIVFMGSSEFSLVALRRLINKGFSVVAVYSRAPKPTGRHYKIQTTVVHEYAEQHDIEVMTPETLKTDEALEQFKRLNADITVVASYGLIIPQSFLDSSLFINIHASLLPRWRGASPVQSAIWAGDTETGVSIMKMDAGLDTGDVLAMKSWPILPHTTSGQLTNDLASLGAYMIENALLDLPNLLTNAKPQSDENSCYAPKISKQMMEIDCKKNCIEVLRQIKALSPSPCAWMEIDGVRVKIIDAKLADKMRQSPNHLRIQCKDGMLEIIEVQPAGKGRMSGDDFARGRRQKTKS